MPIALDAPTITLPSAGEILSAVGAGLKAARGKRGDRRDVSCFLSHRFLLGDKGEIGLTELMVVFSEFGIKTRKRSVCPHVSQRVLCDRKLRERRLWQRNLLRAAGSALPDPERVKPSRDPHLQ